MHLTIRADGGPEIGYGHLIRSNALTEEFLSRDHRVTIATTTPQTAQSIFAETVEIIELPSRGNPEPFVDWLTANSPDAVFTDSYPVDTDYQRAIRDHVPLAVLQDDDRHAVCADLFVNGNLYATNLDYEFVGDPPKTCLGAEYVMLRDEIGEQITGDATFSPRPESLLVLMGGSDVRNSTPAVLEAVDASQYDQRVTAALGPGADNAETVRETASAISQPVECVCDPEDLPRRMFDSDIAVTSTGTTVYELLGLQTPFVGIPQITNQEIIADALAKQDLACVLQKQAPREHITAALDEFVADRVFRHKLHQRGPTVVDSRGAARVTERVLDAATN